MSAPTEYPNVRDEMLVAMTDCLDRMLMPGETVTGYDWAIVIFPRGIDPITKTMQMQSGSVMYLALKNTVIVNGPDMCNQHTAAGEIGDIAKPKVIEDSVRTSLEALRRRRAEALRIPNGRQP